MITYRPYQAEAVKSGLEFFHGPRRNPTFIVIPTGGGKSHIIAGITEDISGMTIVLQPSREILEQNYMKYTALGYRAGIYSDSAGHRYIDTVTFATIGSVINKLHLFKGLRQIIIDECDLVQFDTGLYYEFIKAFPKARVLGLTATPYRLEARRDGATLVFLNYPFKKVFHTMSYCVQNDTLFDAGYLADFKYVDKNIIDRNRLAMNESGSDFTDGSLRALYKAIDFSSITARYANELLEQRKNVLGFCSLVSEAEKVAKKVKGAMVVHAETDPKLRAKISRGFKEGEIPAVFNVAAWLVGFDFPQLETILDASATMSLRRYVQKNGRGARIHPDKKDCMIVDLVGNHSFFGDIESMRIRKNYKGDYAVWNGTKQLTGVSFTKN